MSILKEELLKWSAALEAFETKNYIESLDLFEEMEERGRLLYNRGIIYMALKDDERALSSFTLAIDQDPWFAAALFQRGFIQFSRGKTFEALQDYQLCYQVS
jgi:tetratricopeptide (TPR) repeat protein